MSSKQLPARHEAVILRNKLIKPAISGKLVLRRVFTRFTNKLLNGMKVGLVIAPAGYGKSTLLSQSCEMLSGRGVSCTWISLDNDDNDPWRFFSHLLAAINTLSSAHIQVGTEHLGSYSKSYIDRLVGGILTELETLDFQHALFIDDYHIINNLEIDGILERLVLYSSPKTMFVISSRKEPELAFKTLRMREEVCQLSTRDLAFTANESEQFLNETKQLGLNAELVETLSSRTEGWVAGLQLVSLALEGRVDSAAFIEEFSGTDRDVTDYLGEAVLNQQTDDIKHFLLWTSLLDRMNADMVNAVLEIETAQWMLEHVEARNLFVIPLDRDRIWYRYHHLFADFLSAQLAKKYPGSTEVIYQRALIWCVEQGFQQEAINYALRGGIYDTAIELIAAIVKDLIEISGEHWVVLQWVKQLPDDYVSKRPEIAVFYSWALVFSRQHAKARVLLDMLDGYCDEYSTQLAPELLAELRCGIKLNMCMVEIGFDNTERSSGLVKEWLTANPKAPPRYLLTAYVFQAYSALSTFEIDLGIAAADQAVLIGEEFAVDYLTAWGRSVAGLLKAQQADLVGAANHYRKGLESNNRNASPHSYMGSLNTILLAEACYEQNDLLQAEVLLQDRFEYIDNESVVDVAYAGYRVMAKLQFIRNGLDAGLKVLRLGKESASEAKLARLELMLSALEIRSLFKARKSKEARAVAKECGFDESRIPLLGQNSRPVVDEIRQLVYVELSLDSNFPKRTLTILDGLIAHAERMGRRRRLLDALLLRAKAYKALKRSNDALRDVLRALEIGADGGLYRVFLDAGGEIQLLVRFLLKENTWKLSAGIMDFLRKINAQFQVDVSRQSVDAHQFQPSGTLLESFTKRERQMLDTIVTGETNKEIAEKLFISEQTVKWHLHQLYQKLGVKNRTSAIAKAHALSLI